MGKHRSAKQIFSDLKPYIIASNFIFTICPILVNVLIEPLMTESYLYLRQKSMFQYALSFDGVYYMDNHHHWQSNYAFMPGFVLFIRSTQTLMSLIFTNPQIPTVIVLIVINKLLTAWSAVLLCQLIEHILTKSLAFNSAVLFLFNPASIFYHSVYTEPMFCVMTFWALRRAFELEQEEGKVDDTVGYLTKRLGCLVMFAVSMMVRTSSMFYSLVFGVPILWALFKSNNIAQAFKIAVTGAIVLIFFLGPLLIYIIASHQIFCSSAPLSTFCHQAIPNIYSFVQTYFWTNGFLKFFRIYHFSQGLIGIISFSICLLCLNGSYSTLQRTGLQISFFVVAVMSMLFMSVQSATRFYSTHPVFYIMLAMALQRRKRDDFGIKQLLLLAYFLAYNALGVVFFPLRMVWV